MMTSAQVVETSQSQSNNPSQDYTRLDDHTFKLQTPTYDMTPGFKPFTYQSNRSFTIHPRGNPPGIWTFEDRLVQIPSPWGKKAVRMPHQLVQKYLSSKANLYVFNQTLFTLFRERYAMLTPSDFFWRPFRKSYSLTKAKFYLVNPLNLSCQNRKNPQEYYNRTRDKSGSNSPPFQGNVQVPPIPSTNAQPNAQGMPGGWLLKLQFDRYITIINL